MATDDLDEQLDSARAELAAVRGQVLALITSDYVPSSEQIALALYPSRDKIAEHLPSRDH